MRSLQRLVPFGVGGTLAVLVAATAFAVPPAKDAALPDQPLSGFQAVANSRGIRVGSIGSGIFRARKDKPHEFYMITDRGPNGQPTIAGQSRRTFPVPDFDPAIVKVRVKGTQVEILQQIPLKTSSGAPVTGLPNFAAVNNPLSATPPAPDEVPWNFDASAELLNGYNQNGLDTEDIVRTSTGEFWVVDEYRPSLVKIAADGTVLARYVPVGLADEFTDPGYPVYATLPAAHAYRRQNRGYEGLAISPDGTALFVALQSPLQLPPSTNVGRDSRNTRILRLDTSGNPTGEFIYRFDDAATFDPGDATHAAARARDMKISGLYAVSSTQALVLERTDFVAKVYLVDFAASPAPTDLATWISPSANLNYLESLNADGALESNGVTPMQKTPIVDLETIDGMPDKIESIALTNPNVLAVANDNDFGLTDDPSWTASGDLASDTGTVSRILYVTLPVSFPHHP